MSAPIRVQLSRKKGWRKPENTVVVARPTRWGNPFLLSGPDDLTHVTVTRASAVRWFRDALFGDGLKVSVEDVRRELAGKNLACWCPLDQPCHADVLLRIANREEP